jgi:hypothetical protein
VHPNKAYGGEGIVPLKLDTTWGGVVSVSLRPPYPEESTPSTYW